ncbi:putative leader peptide [Streptomyces sp. NPDC096079]|uniref:putative leader peptide n=1 Tax=unclassified Streptomyces TaxID=2593676 RepID=UPI003329403E
MIRPHDHGPEPGGEAQVLAVIVTAHVPARPRARLVRRRHVDLCRTSSAVCPSPRA